MTPQRQYFLHFFFVHLFFVCLLLTTLGLHPSAWASPTVAHGLSCPSAHGILVPHKRLDPRPLHREDPLEKEMATHSSILAREILWTEEAGRLQSMRSQRVEHNLVTKQQQHNKFMERRKEHDNSRGKEHTNYRYIIKPAAMVVEQTLILQRILRNCAKHLRHYPRQ